jgi:zinc protease
MRFVVLAALFAAFVSFAFPAVAFAATDSKSLKIEIPNGLTVLLLEDHSAPLISYHTWYKVGSRDEAEGITGSAHMLEHMMFQGAKKYTGKQFSKIMQDSGIEWNAFTTNDFTGFYMNLPSDKLEVVMDVEVDRMSSLAIDPKNLQSEREVVKEERRMRIDNNPYGAMYELAMATVFKKSPYRWPVIGHMKDIQNYSTDTLRRFYETYYVPNNAVLVLAGDIDKSKVKKLIEKHYGPLPMKELPPRAPATEVSQTKQYNAVLRKDVQAQTFMVTYQGVPEGHPDMYALDLAATILGSGSSSRLYKRLVYQKQIASSTRASHSSLQDSGMFSVAVGMKPGIEMNQALEIAYNEIFKLRNREVTEDELRKAKTIVMKGYVDGLRTNDSKAQTLAAAEITTGSYSNIFLNLERYEAVKPTDIRRVAQQLLNQEQRSIIVLEPKGMKKPMALAPLANAETAVPAPPTGQPPVAVPADAGAKPTSPVTTPPSTGAPTGAPPAAPPDAPAAPAKPSEVTQ